MNAYNPDTDEFDPFANAETPGGQALIHWARDNRFVFSFTDIIRVNKNFPDYEPASGLGAFRFLCPFHRSHADTVEAGTLTCFGVDGSRGAPFSIRCNDSSCARRLPLDFIGEMKKNIWIEKLPDVAEPAYQRAIERLHPESSSEDTAYAADLVLQAALDSWALGQALGKMQERLGRKCTKEIFDGIFDEARVRSAETNSGHTYETLCLRTSSLTKHSPVTETNPILKDMAETVSLKTDHIEALLRDISGRTKLGKKGLRATYNGFRRKEKPKDKKGDDAESAVLAELSSSLGQQFELPTDALGSFGVEKFAGETWMFRRAISDDEEDQRLTTPFMLMCGLNNADRDEDRGLRAAVLREDGTWRQVEIDPGEIAEGGRGAMGRLRRTGLQMTNAGREFVSHYFLESQPPATTIVHRPGWRMGAFVCPTGEVLLAPSGTVELAQDVRLKCAPRAGNLEGWREGAGDVFGLGVEKAGQFQSGILMGLTGAMSDLAHDDALAFSLETESTRGKSTSQELAVAHWCNPSVHAQEDENGAKHHGLFRPAKGTANSFEGLMEISSGTVAAFDEIGKIAAKEQQDLMFMNQAGAGKHRMKPDGTMRQSRTWGGTAMIVSAETGFAQRLQMENVAQLGGLSARVIAVQVDRWPLLDPKTDWLAIEKTKANFGHSGPAFIHALDKQGFVRDSDKLKILVADCVGQLPHINEGNSAFRQRVARPLGYLWAGGRIAADDALIPVNADLGGLIERLWKDVLASDIGPTDPKARAVIHLFNQLTALKGSSIVNFQDRDEGHREIVGYWNEVIPDPDDNRYPCYVYVVRADKLGELSGGFADAGALRKELETQGVLIRSNDGKSRTWSGYPGLGKGVQYVVLRASGIDA